MLRNSVVNYDTRNREAQGSSRTVSSGLFVGVSISKTFQNPSQVLVKPRE